MSNNIEEDIKILEDYSYAMASISSATEKDIRVSKALENILADRERLEVKANAYDSLVEKIKENIKELNDVHSNYSQRVIYSETSTYTGLAQEILQELLDTEK